MDRRTKNVEIFKDSVKLMYGSSRLQQAITESQNKQKLYLETEDVAVPESKGLSCKTVVSTKRSRSDRELSRRTKVFEIALD